jgi:zinc transporter ZupT
MNYFLPFFAVILGYVLGLFIKLKDKKMLKLALAFSGAFLLSITVMHLLPEIYEDKTQNFGIFIMLGILLQIFLEFFSKGAEHGHVHGNKQIEKMPWLLFVSLCIHAFLEGLPVSQHADLATGIAIHHLPIAIIITLFFCNSGLPKKNIFIFMVVFASMTPLGSLIANQFIAIQIYDKTITAVVIGILFHISSTIIFESSEGHTFNIAKISMIVLGVLLGFLI